ncbi:cytochrome c biogenesis protein [Polyangium spumosum]|uniref:Heme exporter protein C n=1 Tax=Polyangium spumosum TaxID=889282 RepID=A0A6N7PI08_9BACT|nr:cytochrome c biogenesis protein [Polyangium spumosum]MRG91608.1 heme transporter [Polyangium spumosum]
MASSEALAAGTKVETSRSGGDAVFYTVLALTAAAFVISLQVIFFKAPVESTMGIVQKIFYFHVPIAYSMYVGAAACFVGSAGYLAKGTRGWDAFARAGAETAVAMGILVLVTGALWGAKAWGVYWTWDPRLTTALLSVLIYVAYVVLRAFAGDGDAERKFAAALGVLGAANLPIIHYSVQKWGGNHPKVITSGGGGIKHPDMKLALLLGFVTFTLLAVVLIWTRVRIELASARLGEAEEEALELGVGEE